MEKMTNAEAIETLRANCPDACFEQLREAIDKAIKALEADVPDTNVGDMISRQAAIEALDVLCGEHRYRIPGKRETYSQYNEAWQDALDRAEGAIFNLPSADAVKVVRCWNCIWWDNCPSSTITPNFHKCKRVGRMSMPSNGYCSYGEENKK